MRILFTTVLILTLTFNSQAQSDVRITGVNTGSQTVTLTNLGDASESIGNHWLCNFPAYDQLNSLPVLGGSLSLMPGASVTVSWSDASGGDGECGYYSTNTFTSAAAMIDYFEWGSAFHTRETVAVSAGLWASGTFVAGSPPFGFIGGSGDHGFEFWIDAVAQVRIIKVDTEFEWVYLKNFGTIAQDMTVWELCNFPLYETIGGSNFILGDATIDPGETVIIGWSPASGNSGELGLYNFADFNNELAMEDYMEWGEGGHFRESVAVSKGIWGAGDFTPNGQPYCFTGGFGDFGVAFWSSTIEGCTYPEAENYDSTATVDDGLCIFPEICEGDLTGDDFIDTADLLGFLTVFGTACP